MGPNVFAFSLSEADARRLASFMPEITVKLCPGIQQHAIYNGEIRCRRKGSLALYPDGPWMDYEADHGGWGAVSLIKHLTEWGDVDATRYARNWLKEHSGVGSFQIDPISEAAAQARDELYARRAQEAIEQRQPLAGTISERNLLARGLVGPWPEGLGHLAAGRLAEQALIVLLTAPDSEILGVQLGYLTLPEGKKSTRMPPRQQFWLTADPERRRTGLFRIPAVPRAADDDVLKDTTLICEGAEKAIAGHMAFPTVPVLALCGIGRLTHIPPIPGLVVLVRDGDEPSSAASKLVVRGVDHLLQTGTSTVKVTATPLGADADSIVKEAGVEALRELILAASPVELSFKTSTQQLVKIYDRFEFDAAREALAKRAAPLGIRKSTIDAEVAAARRAAAGDAMPLDPAAALGPEPWPDKVDDIGAVLSKASDVVARHVIATQATRDMSVLWCLLSHFVHHETILIPISPRLEIRAVAPECGKTTLLTMTMFMVWHPFPAASLTPATVYRVLDKFRPTLILDEVDTQLRSNRNPELNAVLRASHNRHFAKIPRSVKKGDNWDVELFSAWGTYAYTTLGKIGDEALESRSIKVTLKRATVKELVTFQYMIDGTSPELIECGRKFARWAQDQTELPNTVIPDTIVARDRDNLRSILRMAELFSEDWQQRTRQAAIEVNGVSRAIGDIVPLLTDIRRVYGQREWLATRQLCEELKTLDEPSADWPVIQRGRPVTEYYLRTQLKGVMTDDIPENERRQTFNGRKVRGYMRKHFADAFARYVPTEEDEEEAIHLSDTAEDVTTPAATETSDTSAVGAEITLGPTAEEDTAYNPSMQGPGEAEQASALYSSGTSGPPGASGSTDQNVNNFHIDTLGRMQKFDPRREGSHPVLAAKEASKSHFESPEPGSIDAVPDAGLSMWNSKIPYKRNGLDTTGPDGPDGPDGLDAPELPAEASPKPSSSPAPSVVPSAPVPGVDDIEIWLPGEPLPVVASAAVATDDRPLMQALKASLAQLDAAVAETPGPAPKPPSAAQGKSARVSTGKRRGKTAAVATAENGFGAIEREIIAYREKHPEKTLAQIASGVQYAKSFVEEVLTRYAATVTPQQSTEPGTDNDG